MFIEVDKFDGQQLIQISLGIVNNLDYSIYAKPEFNWEQMREIRVELEKIKEKSLDKL